MKTHSGLSMNAPGRLLVLVGLGSALSATALADEASQGESDVLVLDSQRAVGYSVGVSEADETTSEPAPEEAAAPNTSQSEDQPNESGPAESDAPRTFSPQGVTLPSGDAKSGVTAKAISLPSGPGSVQGMGESFSVAGSTGVAAYALSFALPAARGGAQPALSLVYSSSGGTDVAGAGWGLSIASISRQSDKGIPHYADQSDWHAEQDRFVFSGGRELVPICTVDGDSCIGALADEVMPTWADGWQYFRSRVEGGFERFFWSPDHRTWRVQEKSGLSLELGVALDDTSVMAALERNPDRPDEIFRWHLVRQWDTQISDELGPDGLGAPVNVVRYRYFSTAGRSYLTDVYDTSPAADPTSQEVADFAHHTRLVYEGRTDVTSSYRSGYRVDNTLRLARVDVASKTFDGTGARELVRRYHLSYDESFVISILQSIQIEGTCADSAEVGISGDETLQCALGQTCELVGATSCPRLPATRFEYAHVVAGESFEGFEEFNTVAFDVPNPPPLSLDAAAVDFFDVNSDALPDVIATAPELFSDQHGVYFNRGVGAIGEGFEAARMGILTGTASDGIDTTILDLSNTNVRPLDADGDGTADLVHMPRTKKYDIFTPVETNGEWNWLGRAIETASEQEPKIDFTTNARRIRTADVNFDGLIDIVASTGTQIQTFFALGRYPGGDGQFGHARWLSKDTAELSNDPVTSCVPWSGTSVGFEDTDIDFADMNGDGIADIVRMRPNDVRYWPGRGNGMWGTGARDDCLEGSFGEERHVQMANPPTYQVEQGESLLVDDVNGDGFADLVEVRFTDVDIYLNVNGYGWTPRRVIAGTPPKPASTDRVRLTDLDGSGTLDVVWGTADAYRILDLQAGVRARTLTAVHNGLGATTRIEYTTSTQEMLAAAATGSPWTMTMPTVVPVVKRTTRTENIQISGQAAREYTTEYEYRNPVYEGRQREFRGFRDVKVATLGDNNSPTGITETRYLLGECVDEVPGDALDACAAPQRWMDNPREALKGTAVATHQYDTSGRYLSTTIAAQRLAQLYTGRDGRVVRHSYSESTRSYLYDYDNFVVGATSLELESVHQTGTDCDANPAACEPISVELPSSQGRVLLEQQQEQDAFGNTLTSTSLGCTEGCSSPDEQIVATSLPELQEHASGWLWRTREQYTEGDLHAELRNHTRNAYDPRGNIIRTEAYLEGTLPLAPADPGVVTNPAASSEAPGWIDVLSEVVYDAFGNPLRQRAPNGRCADTGYDVPFAQLAVSETAYTGGCDVGALTSGALYDRGFALATEVADIQEQVSSAEYDAFGRPLRVFRPHPDAGQTCELPAVEFTYLLPPDVGPNHSIIVTKAADSASCNVSGQIESYEYVDGLGRVLVTLGEADTSEGFGNDLGQWIVSGQVAYDAKGARGRAYLPRFSNGDPLQFDYGAAPDVAFGTQSYDAFGRDRTTRDLDTTPTLSVAYHALSKVLSDAADLQPMGLHAATPFTQRQDGHGRLAETVETFKDPSGAIESRHTLTDFLPTGEPERIVRKRGSTGDEVVRWMRYDSIGRLVLNVEPNSSVGFDPDPTTDPDSVAAWRYAYDDAGDLVGITDARGCGRGFEFDPLGRLLAEDYYPCTATHPAYTPRGAGSTGAEVRYQYDAVPQDLANDAQLAGFFLPARFLRGRLVRVSDRAADTITSFDGRGRAWATARRIVKPNPGADLSARYAPHWYRKAVQFDAADRVVQEQTGASATELLGDDGSSVVTTQYTARGTVGYVGGSYGVLVDSVTRSADGLVAQTVLGDLARTRSDRTYDTRRRLQNLVTYRAAPGTWPADHETASPETFQMSLRDDEFVYDIVGNPTTIFDHRSANEWPAGAKPVHRTIAYDDLYRLRSITYDHGANGDDWISPLDAENNGLGDVPNPSPHVAFDQRVKAQSYDYDWLGNTQQTADDASGFYDRSLGVIVNGVNVAGPYQLHSASLAGPNGGALQIAYDDAGNMARLILQRDGPCLPAGASCDQWYEYDWDEIGNLTRARRWDGVSESVSLDDPVPSEAPDADLNYAYDANDQRVIKSTSVEGDVRYTAYIFSTLELRRAEWIDDDYERTAATESTYLGAQGVNLGRVVFEPEVDPSVVDADAETPDVTDLQSVPGVRRVFFELGDHLGSTGAVLDKASSELVERTSYLAYGATDNDYRPLRWNGFREDYKFTGKEEDIEVGLTYFGKRYLNAYLQRWISPDPLEIQAPGNADSNTYAYVTGSPLMNVDPVGLAEDDFQSFPVGGVDAEDVAGQDVAASYDDAALANQSTAVPVESQGQPSTSGTTPGAARARTNFGQVTSYPDKLRTSVAKARSNCKDGVCELGGWMAETFSVALAFPGDVANAVNTGARAVESFGEGEYLEGTAETLQLVGSVTYGIQAFRSTTSTLLPQLRFRTPAQQAAAAQGSTTYPGVDSWVDTTIPEGQIVWAGTPGVGQFYTTTETVASSRLNAIDFFGAVQVTPDKVRGFRDGVTAFRVTQPTPAGVALTSANSSYGPGGAVQFYIPNPEASLLPLVSFPLK